MQPRRAVHIRCGNESEARYKILRILANRGIGEPDSPTSMPVGKIYGTEFLSDIGVSCSKNAEHPSHREKLLLCLSLKARKHR